MKRDAIRAGDWVLVSKSDTDNFSRVPEGLWVTVGGDISLVSGNNNVMVIAVDAGPLSLCPARINSTGTTATVYALY